MQQIVTSDQMKELDRMTIEGMGVPSLVLMERAALSVTEELKNHHNLDRVLVVCGSGNNGADGMAIARILHLQGFSVEVYLAGNPNSFTNEAKVQWNILENYSVPVVKNCKYGEYTTIVDAIFGVGLSREVSGKYAALIQEINDAAVPVVAVDIPSGIHGTTGRVMGTAIRADKTVTFAYLKIGLCLYPGASYAGRVIVKDIGIYGTADSPLYGVEETDGNWLPNRNPEGNKGTFGKVLVIAGSKNMCGAAYLSAKACLLTGCGMVTIFTSKENRAVLQQLLPEAIISAYDDDTSRENLEQLLAQAISWSDTILAGPGLGRFQISQWIVDYLLQETKRPIILDADALNILSENPERFYKNRQNLILTPHLGEMSRLSGYGIQELKEYPLECLRQYGERFDVPKNIVMKDARTLTLTTDKTCYINLTGNCGMATAGSGDVLAGMITGLVAQGMELSKAAPFGVWLHGKAGDDCKKKKGVRSMLASDLLDSIPCILNHR